LSHIVEIETQVQDATAVAAVCRRLGLTEPVHGSAKLFSGEASGLIVKLPDWQFPIVIDTATGEIRYDSFGGRWGNHKHLDRFLQVYAAEKVKIESRKRGNVCSEQQMADGSIKLTIQVGGAV